MAWGVLEDKKMFMPPGTVKLGASESEAATETDSKDLKKDGNIVLQPQPSDSPNDPLNWSVFWKNTIIIVLAFNSGVTVSLGPMITPGVVILSQQYKVSLDMVSTFMIGLLQFWTGFTTFFTASGASVWGKRPFFVISTAILLGSNVWGFFATTFTSLALCRVLQGIASAPLETLVTSTVSDLFFVHQRGTRLSIWGVMVASGVLLGQIISGFIIESLGVRATFGISAIIYSVLLPMTYYLVPETTYNTRANDMVAARTIELREKGDDEINLVEVTITSDADPKRSYRSQLALFRGRLSPESFWKGVIKPIPLIAYPAVLFSTIVYGSYFTWLILLSLLSNTIFSAPPYNLTPSQVGLTNLPLLGAALIFNPLAGFLADFVAKWMARKNGGIFEPEYRLTMMLVATPLANAAFLGFGHGVQDGAKLWVLLVWGTLMSISVPFANAASFTYVIDCHPKDANQAFVTINFVKAVMIFVGTTFANSLYFKFGPRVLFDGIMLINFTLCLLTIPAYVYGKRFRSMIARSSLPSRLA